MGRTILVVPFHQDNVAWLHVADCWAKVFVKFALQPVFPRLAPIVSAVTHDDSASRHGVNNKTYAVNAESVSTAMAPFCADPLASLGNA
tara:strand:+ start:132 stop:398 length:267 start_codon:yes stop_codon:yes gene_type:complete